MIISIFIFRGIEGSTVHPQIPEFGALEQSLGFRVEDAINLSRSMSFTFCSINLFLEKDSVFLSNCFHVLAYCYDQIFLIMTVFTLCTSVAGNIVLYWKPNESYSFFLIVLTCS